MLPHTYWSTITLESGKIEIKSEHLRHLKRTFHGTLSMLRSLSRGGSGLFYQTQFFLSNTKCFIKQKINDCLKMLQDLHLFVAHEEEVIFYHA